MTKKPYSAPELFAESFRMCEHIASCSIKGTPLLKNTMECKYSFEAEGGSIVELFTIEGVCILEPSMVQDDYWGSNPLITS